MPYMTGEQEASNKKILIKKAHTKAHELRRKIAPYFLRREKKDVLTCSSSTEAKDTTSEAGADTDAAPDQHSRKQLCMRPTCCRSKVLDPVLSGSLVRPPGPLNILCIKIPCAF
eukprot:scaffold191903_cov18-Tisochrysis_lutea.AAC.1